MHLKAAPELSLQHNNTGYEKETGDKVKGPFLDSRSKKWSL